MRNAFLFFCLIVPAYSSAETFSDWQQRWTQERSSVLQQYEKRIATDGLQAVYTELQGDVQSIEASTDEERRWKSSFSCAMQANSRSDTLVDSIDDALDASVEGTLSAETRGALQRAADSLGISRYAFHRRLKKLGLTKSDAMRRYLLEAPCRARDVVHELAQGVLRLRERGRVAVCRLRAASVTLASPSSSRRG